MYMYPSPVMQILFYRFTQIQTQAKSAWLLYSRLWVVSLLQCHEDDSHSDLVPDTSHSDPSIVIKGNLYCVRIISTVKEHMKETHLRGWGEANFGSWGSVHSHSAPLGLWDRRQWWEVETKTGNEDKSQWPLDPYKGASSPTKYLATPQWRGRLVIKSLLTWAFGEHYRFNSNMTSFESEELGLSNIKTTRLSFQCSQMCSYSVLIQFTT